jgi:GNAT superfamily N-acetyltransferase
MPNTTFIRRPTENDRAAVASLWHDAWHDGHGSVLPPAIVAERTEATFVARLSEFGASDLLVAERDGVIVGFAALLGDEVDQLYVAGGARGTGIARTLIAAAEAELGRRGVERAVIQCSEGNVRAHRFYSRTGWTDSGLADLPLWTADERRETHPTHVFVKHLSRLD